jgi:hypothetical protein
MQELIGLIFFITFILMVIVSSNVLLILGLYSDNAWLSTISIFMLIIEFLVVILTIFFGGDR